MIFIGESGSGKSTLLTSLKDYIRFKDFENRSQTVKERALGES